MRKLLVLVPVIALGALIAGIAFARRTPASLLARPAYETVAEYVASLSPVRAPETTLRYRFDTAHTYLYRFDSTGEVDVRPPAESPQTPQKSAGRFELNGILALHATTTRQDGSAEIEFQFRDVHVTAGNPDAAAKLQGRTACVSMDARGRMLDVTSAEGMGVFLRNFEVVLPANPTETPWKIEGRDASGTFTAQSSVEGHFESAGHTIARIKVVRTYTAEPRKGSLGARPVYTTEAHFDTVRGLPVAIDVHGQLPEGESSGIALSGGVHLTFALAEVVDGALTPQEHLVRSTPERRKPEAPSTTPSKMPTLEAIEPDLSAPNKIKRAHAVLQLSGIRTPEAHQHALTALADPEFTVRAAAATALGAWKDEETAQTLALALRDDAADLVRLRAAQALAGSPFPASRLALEEAAKKDSSAHVRQVASESLVVKRSVK